MLAATCVAVFALAVTACDTGGNSTTTVTDATTTTSTVPSTTTTTSAPTTTTTAPSTTTTTIPDAPWAADPIPASDAPEPLLDSWNEADNADTCAPLAPTVVPDGFTPRTANFAGGWAVAWDAPDLRSAFGVAGAGIEGTPDLAERWPSVVHYADGSVLGYGGEGMDPNNPKRLGELVIPGQGCLYQIWSQLGDEQLVSLVDSLRFVDVG